MCLLFLCIYCVFHHRGYRSEFGGMSNRRVCFSYKEIRVVHATFEWPCNRRNETRTRARATETRRYITSLQTLSRCCVIARGSLNQMRLSHEHPIAEPSRSSDIRVTLSVSHTNNERPDQNGVFTALSTFFKIDKEL